MANPFQQKVRTRKLIYTLLILALFTGSLLHRRFVVEHQAYDLQLREISRGNVDFTSSAVRLTLTGSSGIANTFLWWTALRKQEKHEWNELELLVNSITKLQPYFVTPWLFQSWNLAYNVAVECDRPRDKYYYISRGLELLAEGERRNQGGGIDGDPRKPKFPGNPDMRFNLGMFYQMKIGNSDEKTVMRCLLDLSCIDPMKREPAKLRTDKEFAAFCQDNPRLVRRLREGLSYTTSARILKFLEDNKDVPTRFEKPSGNLTEDKCKLKPVREQFPVLPPQLKQKWPNAEDRGLSHESIDVYLMARTWFEYAQMPLPAPVSSFDDPNVYDPLQHRVPRNMTVHIFRGYPAVAQENIAQILEEEGFFFDDGWVIKDWFERGISSEQDFCVGKESKYHARPAWEIAFEMYRDYGIENGMYVTAAEYAELLQKAAEFQERVPKERRFADPRQYWNDEGFRALMKLDWIRKYAGMTNYNERLGRADAERTRELVLARKLFFEAERMRRYDDPEQALARYEQAFPLWIDVALSHPVFAGTATLQEDIYELQLNYMRLLQKQRAYMFRPLAIGMAQMNVWPYQFVRLDRSETDPPDTSLEEVLTGQQKLKVLPIRNVRGLMDQVIIYNAPHFREMRDFVTAWTAAAGCPPLMVMPAQRNLALTSIQLKGDMLHPSWTSLLDPEVIESVRERRGMNRDQKKDFGGSK
ncbi:MAG: hypothetical protein HY040_23435 [Planctomycetes bacterium]|nr:hypothetical protein [Planctomycetota bacterium]